MSPHSIHSLTILAALAVCTAANPMFEWNSQGNVTMVERNVLDLTGPQYPIIKKLAAIGDSYSAGIGAGNKLRSPWNGPWIDWTGIPRVIQAVGAVTGALGIPGVTDAIRDNGKLDSKEASNCH